MDTKNPQRINVTVESVVSTINDALHQSAEEYEKRNYLIDKVLQEATNDRDKFTYTMFQVIFQDLHTIILKQSINALSIINLLIKEKSDLDNSALIEQLQKDIIHIKNTHSPVIDAMKKAFENKKKWLGDNR